MNFENRLAGCAETDAASDPMFHPPVKVPPQRNNLPRLHLALSFAHCVLYKAVIAVASPVRPESDRIFKFQLLLCPVTKCTRSASDMGQA